MRYPDAKKIRLYAAVGRTLRGFREGAGLTLDALHERTGISRGQMLKIEDGTTACPLHVLVALADEYDVTLDDLVPVLPDARAA